MLNGSIITLNTNNGPVTGKLYVSWNGKSVGFRSSDDKVGDTALYEAVRNGDKRFKFEYGGPSTYGHVGVVLA